MEKVLPAPAEPGTARWGYLALGTAAMLFMGVIYAWSILKVPLAETFGWSPSQLALNYALIFCFFCIGGMVSSVIAAKWGARITILLGGLLICFGYFALSRVTDSHVLRLYFLYGLPVGAGTGMAYNTILAWVGAWFPDKRGTCSGILMMGFGFSALVMGNLLSVLFALPGFGWRGTYLALGGSVLVVLAVCALVFRHAPPVPTPSPPAEGEGAVWWKEYTPKEMLRQPSFWKFYVYGIFTGMVGGAVFAFTYDLCLSLGASHPLATTSVGLLSACNGLSRIFTGVLYDKLGRRRTMFLGSLVVLISATTLLASILTQSLALCIFGLCITGLGYGYGPVSSAAVIHTFYGGTHFSANYSINNTKVFICSFASTLATALLTATGTYATPFVAMVGFAAVAFVLSFSIERT